MAKNYPPYIEGTIPAFYGDSITVPFSMNKAVGKTNFNGFSLLIKTIQTGQQVEEVSTSNYDLDNGIVTFNITRSRYSIGQSYKIQLAYIDGADIGYYSTVAVSKYTKEPEICIQGLSRGKNAHKYNYVGEYSTEDITEKMYSCQFIVYDQNDNIIQDSGEIIHNSLDDEQASLGKYKASQQFNLNEELESGKNYYIRFLVKTIGLMELDTGKYQIVQGEPIPADRNILVSVKTSNDNGYVDISMKYSNGTKLKGQYILSRTSGKSNFKKWDEIIRFTINGEYEKQIWKDFTVEQGGQYQYAVIAVDADNNYSTKSISDLVKVDFEDIFLFDGDKQLRVRFDPNVNNFKTTVLEQKTDTVGGKHPYIFRNGHVNYKEFSISGLLTHLLDEDGYFEYALAQRKNVDGIGGMGLYTTQLNSENIVLEREFKLEVLNWLNNGKPKLFRSPTEGNYIVRLMNVSLSPVEELGRMLHSFTCNAYEIAEYTHKNLLQLEIIKDNLLIGMDKIFEEINYGNVALTDLTLHSNYINTLGISEATGIKFVNYSEYQDVYVNINGNDINIRLTQELLNTPIKSLKASVEQINNRGGYAGKGAFILYYQKEKIPSISDTILKVETLDIPILQISGGKDVYSYSTADQKINLLDKILLESTDYISQIFSITCNRRNVQKVRIKNDNWNELYQYLQNVPLEQVSSTVYMVYDELGSKVLGYKDGELNFPFTLYPSLQNLNDSEMFSISFTNNNGNTVKKIIPSEGTVIDSSNIDFSTITSIVSELFLDISICCRVGQQIPIVNKVLPETYRTALNTFLNNLYTTQTELVNALNIIQLYYKGGLS